MTPLRLAAMALFAVTAAAAVALAYKDKRNKPIAWYLVAVVALDFVRIGLSQLLPATRDEREGLVLVARHAEMAAFLGGIMLLPAMTMALFLRRRPWLIGAVYLVIAVALIASYPAIRGDELMRLYTFIELACVVASFGFWIMWLRSPRLLEEGASVPIMSGVVLTCTTMATVLLPPLTGPEVLTKWSIFVALHATSSAFVLIVQLRYLLAGKGKL